jgi:hypothetical protein
MKTQNLTKIFRSTYLLGLICQAAISCGTKRNPDVCHFEPCLDGFVCNTEQRCVPASTTDGGLDAIVDAASDLISSDGPTDMSVTPDGATGDAMGTCLTSADCKQPTTPLCVAGACAPCSQAATGACAQANSATPFCAQGGECVGCLVHADCPVASPICGPARTCVACNATGAPSDTCSKREAAKSVCATNGNVAGQCVGCVTDNTCGSIGAPICDKVSNTCRRCDVDAECIAKVGADPGVCMAHDDGRCATASETQKVQGGDLQAAITAAIAGGKKLVLVSESTDRAVYPGPGKLAIVGKGLLKPPVGGGTKPGISITGGELFLRDLAITNSAPGVSVTNASLLRMTSCEVTGNNGGILIDGASFDIQVSEISDNKIGTFGVAKWGGVLANNPGTPKRLSKVKVLNNKQTGLVCSVAITLDQVTATGNVPEDIAMECQ